MKRILTWAALSLIALTSPVLSQSYPAKPIMLVVPVPPGGQIDSTARRIADALSKDLGQPVVIMNRPGGSMIVGTLSAAKAKPDGYTLLYGNTNLAVNPAVQPSLPYDTLKELEPVTMLVKAANVVIARPDAPFGSLAELVSVAKTQKQALKYSSYGIGAPTHLTIELLSSRHKINLVHLPYSGNAPALEALLGGHVDFMMIDTTTAAPLIRSGRVKALAVATKARSPSLSDVPTVVEAGEPEMAHLPFQGILAPAGTPPAIVGKLHASIVKIMENDDLKRSLESNGFDVVSAPGGEMRRTMEEEIAYWKNLMTTTGIKIQQ